jgi:hypothetical protein
MSHRGHVSRGGLRGRGHLETCDESIIFSAPTPSNQHESAVVKALICVAQHLHRPNLDKGAHPDGIRPQIMGRVPWPW